MGLLICFFLPLRLFGTQQKIIQMGPSGMRALLWDQLPFFVFLPPPVLELNIKDYCCSDVQDFGWFVIWPFLATQTTFEVCSLSLCSSQR